MQQHVLPQDDWDEILAWFRRAVDCLGHKEVAYRLDIGPTQLSDALNERERKDIKAKWLCKVRRLCEISGRDVLVREYLEIISKQHGYEEPKRKRARTPEEEVAAMREVLKREAPGVLAILDKELAR